MCSYWLLGTGGPGARRGGGGGGSGLAPDISSIPIYLVARESQNFGPYLNISRYRTYQIVVSRSTEYLSEKYFSWYMHIG